MKILATEKLGPHRYKDNHGYLICTNCILARTGEQEYTRNECFGDKDETKIMVDRKPADVFDPKTMASFENVPVTIEHPNGNVDPDNHNSLSVGFVRDIKKGKYDGQDVMMGTIVLTDSLGIEKVENNELTNLSCGYECDVDDSDHPHQFNIRGNHVALCELPRAGITHIQDSLQNNHSLNYSKNVKVASFLKGDVLENEDEELYVIPDLSETYIIDSYYLKDDIDNSDIDISKIIYDERNDQYYCLSKSNPNLSINKSPFVYVSKDKNEWYKTYISWRYNKSQPSRTQHKKVLRGSTKERKNDISQTNLARVILGFGNKENVIPKDKEAHHIDGVKENDNFENLIFLNFKEHYVADKIIKKLKKGTYNFNKEEKELLNKYPRIKKRLKEIYPNVINLNDSQKLYRIVYDDYVKNENERENVIQSAWDKAFNKTYARDGRNTDYKDVVKEILKIQPNITEQEMRYWWIETLDYIEEPSDDDMELLAAIDDVFEEKNSNKYDWNSYKDSIKKKDQLKM